MICGFLDEVLCLFPFFEPVGFDILQYCSKTFDVLLHVCSHLRD